MSRYLKTEKVLIAAFAFAILIANLSASEKATANTSSLGPDPVTVSEIGPGVVNIQWTSYPFASNYLVYVNGQYKGWTYPWSTIFTVSGLARGSTNQVQIWAASYYGWVPSQVVTFRMDEEPNAGNPLLQMPAPSQDFAGNGFKLGHLGVDLPRTVNTSVRSIGRGMVTEAKNFLGDWGNVVIVEHNVKNWPGKVYSMYAHLNRIDVVRGQWIDKFHQVGLSGIAGTGPHLHFEIRTGATAGRASGPGYANYTFSGIAITVNGITFYKPSWFIDKY